MLLDFVKRGGSLQCKWDYKQLYTCTYMLVFWLFFLRLYLIDFELICWWFNFEANVTKLQLNSQLLTKKKSEALQKIVTKFYIDCLDVKSENLEICIQFSVHFVSFLYSFNHIYLYGNILLYKTIMQTRLNSFFLYYFSLNLFII